MSEILTDQKKKTIIREYCKHAYSSLPFRANCYFSQLLLCWHWCQCTSTKRNQVFFWRRSISRQNENCIPFLTLPVEERGNDCRHQTGFPLTVAENLKPWKRHPDDFLTMERASEMTPGAITDIFKTGDASTHPVVQIVELKKISHSNSNPNAAPRYRLAISDGSHFQQAMIATQLNVLITEHKLTLNCLVRIKEVICNTVQQKKIVIILNLEVVAQLPAKVGNPVSIDLAMSAANQQAQAPYGTENQAPNAMNPAGNGYGQNAQQGGYGQNGYGAAAKNQVGYGQPRPTGSTGFGSGGTWRASNPQANPYSSSSGAISMMKSSPVASYRPIQSINPYQNGWTIRGRCTYKSDIRTFMNSRGEGKVISFEVTDESGSIRVTGFTQHAQQIDETVHLNKIYKISRGSLKQANEKYNRSTSNFEMTLDRNSVFEELDDDGSFMQVKYNFVKIANLESVDVKGNCDVIGVVTGIGPLGEIIIRSTGEPCNKRSITITDDSNASVELTLWRKQAETFLTEDDLARSPVLLLRNAQRGDFGGVSLNVSRMTTMELDPPQVQDANKLRAWFDSGGLNTAKVQSVTAGLGGGGGKVTGPRKSLQDARTENVDPVFSNGDGSGGANATFSTRAVISFINTKNELYYPGDPETKKKLIDQGQGTWLSESTGRQLTDEEVSWRYMISMKVMDHSSSQWVSGFDEVGQVLFGRSGKEFRDLYHNDRAMFDNIVEDATFRPLVMRIQVKERRWKEEQQIRYTISRVEPVDFATEGHTLLQEIASFGGM